MLVDLLAANAGQALARYFADYLGPPPHFAAFVVPDDPVYRIVIAERYGAALILTDVEALPGQLMIVSPIVPPDGFVARNLDQLNAGSVVRVQLDGRTVTIHFLDEDPLADAVRAARRRAAACRLRDALDRLLPTR